ncbi:MAG: hypothetical protein ACFFG0_02735 [Candidatus Thorarchaeota archaeon]
MKHLIDYERDYGQLDVHHIRHSYCDDLRNRRIKRQSFVSYLAGIIQDSYGVSHYIALRFARQLV